MLETTNSFWEEYKLKWVRMLEAKGHTPILDSDGKLDVWVLDFGNHNGPGCSVCGFSLCYHCDPEGDTIPEGCFPRS